MIRFRLAELTGFRDAPPASDADMLIPHSDDLAVLRKHWGVLLMIAVFDGATSLHYHPWRQVDKLTYIVSGVRYEMVPPPDDMAGAMVVVARSLFTPAARGRLLGWVRRTGTACSSVELDVWGSVVVWDGVVWSTGERSGVELFRITPVS